MALYVNTNVASLNAQRNLNNSTSSLSTSLQRLSSGLRVNSAKDDAAGMAIATGMTSAIRGSQVAMRNANDAISMAQTAEGVLDQVESNTQRMRELAVQGANASVTSSNRAQIKLELDALGKENKRLLSGATFNGTSLFKNNASQNFVFQVGSGTSANDRITLNIKAAAFSAATRTNAFSTQANARSVMSDLDNSLKALSTMRASLGAAQNRFSAVVTSLQTYSENMSASKSRIMDTDFATETANMTRNQIIQQAGTAMLAQANQLPSAAMSLLR
ncbi:flagellin FliC [Laribacter hongkongensis]|uniref:flagellin N-terminal helical domain-containing protein n=1 Tax=Laribacter hongkongensis TaxID=168471 RepID=UPI001EFE68E4|nr:flagellin [Laribacter hongkongensis]MCG8993024.1 flagellin FliC [Laribacter hongkongensis]MCG8998770.1 flagellin FliC [Laribacter hongkongensis]MCG9002120.1 flagellin FliC [Laribacter hongkongensis]MCG9005295.1 flagellin FliC [Laribacter hongkongensis]MCG9007809.1 flagellin FliC [Laribacter hongkongensis]